MTIREKIERDGFRKWIAKLLLIKIPLAFVAVTVLWVLMLKWMPVWVTPLMISRSMEYRSDDTFRTHKKWRSYEKISPELAKAVIASEDNLFATHNGFDWKEMKKAIKDHKEKGYEGGLIATPRRCGGRWCSLPFFYAAQRSTAGRS